MTPSLDEQIAAITLEIANMAADIRHREAAIKSIRRERAKLVAKCYRLRELAAGLRR